MNSRQSVLRQTDGAGITGGAVHAGRPTRIRFLLGIVLTALAVESAAAAPLLAVYGSPTYDQTTLTGDEAIFTLGDAVGPTAGNGLAVAQTRNLSGSYTPNGYRAVRWDASGNATELGNLGVDSTGYAFSQAYSLNGAGIAVGSSIKFVGGVNQGTRAVRWDASGTSATELGNLGIYSYGFSSSVAYATNASGVIAGYAQKINADSSFGFRAVRWDAAGNATELGNLGTDSSGSANGHAYDINAAGLVVGDADKYVGGANKGTRAVRWNASGTAATELGNLGTDGFGFTNSEADLVNSAGTAVGVSDKYSGGVNVGSRAVRWDSSGTAATELGNLGVNSFGYTVVSALGLNDAGMAVGAAYKYVGGNFQGIRAVAWDASNPAAIELDSLGGLESQAFGINSVAAVGYKRNSNQYSALLWNSDGTAIDLNSLIDPDSGWTLNYAVAISDTNWVTGYGTFDPDGPGPLYEYGRAFLLDVSPVVVPEPATFTHLILMAAGIVLQRGWGCTFRKLTNA